MDSIFYITLILSAVGFLAAESLSLLRWRGSSPSVRRIPNPRAPLAWALLPAILIVSLSFVQWRKPAPIAEAASPTAFTLVTYAR